MRRVLRHSGGLSKGTLESCVYVGGVNNAASDAERQERQVRASSLTFSFSLFSFSPHAAPSIL